MTRGSCLNNLWTDALVAEALRLRDVGKMTNQAIADRLGIPAITRNAVIGKLRRVDAAAGTIQLPPPKTTKRAARVDRMKDWQPKPVANAKEEAKRSRQLRVSYQADASAAKEKIEAERRRQLRQRDAAVKATKKPVASPYGNMVRLRQVRAGVEARSAPVAAVSSEPTARTNVPLLDLQYGMCRYPIGPPMERAVLFCGGPAEVGTSWCCAHAQRVFQAPPQRRGRPPVYQPKPTFEEA